MNDKYDKPHEDEGVQLYEESPMDKAGEIGGSALDIVKEHWKKILAAIVVILVLFFAYDFFIGSVKEVSFSAVDTEGKPVNAAIRVLSESGQEIKRISSAETISLKIGNYKIDVQAQGYKAIRAKPITVSESSAIEQELEISKDLELAGEFPPSFASGEAKEVELIVTSKEPDAVEMGLVLEGDAKSAMTIEYEKPLMVRPGENTITATLKVKAALEKNSIGTAKTGTIRIQGLSSKSAIVSGKYSLVQFDQKNVKLTIGSSNEKLDYGNVKAGDHVEKTFKIRNDNSFEIENVLAAVKITQAESGEISEIQKWFKFSPGNTLNVGAKSDETITLIADIPSGFRFPQGKDTSVIDGVISASTSYFEKDVDFRMVVNRPKAAVTVSGIQEIVTLSKTAGAYNKITQFLTIKNNGEVLLTNFDARISCDSQGTSWLTFGDGTLEYAFDSLGKGLSVQAPYVIQVPDSTTASQIVNCRIGVLYTDPGENRQTVQLLAIIKT